MFSHEERIRAVKPYIKLGKHPHICTTCVHKATHPEAMKQQVSNANIEQ